MADFLSQLTHALEHTSPPRMNIYTFFSLVVILPVTLWLYTALVAPSTFPTLSGARILLLTAHPDDEAMFFSPTITALSDPSLGNQIKLLCLSSGDADGLGATRREELIESAKVLGLAEKDAVCLDIPELRDGMNNEWDDKVIADLLFRAFVPDAAAGATAAPTKSDSARKRGAATTAVAAAAKKRKNNEGSRRPLEAHLDAIITFDEGGVSGHANHKACLRGARAFLAALAESAGPGWEIPVALYTLSSVSLLRKYIWCLDVPASVAMGLGKIVGRRRTYSKSSSKRFPSWLLYVSGVGSLRKGQRAMVSAHKSQMVWFRWGWIGVGRYMVVNDLRRVDGK